MFDFSSEQLLRGILIFLRIGGVIFALPIFGDAPTPIRTRILLSVALAIGLEGVVPAAWAPTHTPDGVNLIAWLVIRELLIGLVLGFIARLMFEGLVMASTIVGFQMGFGTAGIMLPGSDTQMTSFSALHRIIMVLIFLSLSLHHVFIRAIADSFLLIPAGSAIVSAPLDHLLTQLSAGVFVVGLELAAPVLVALLFTMAALGLLARTVPQMNVFNMSFPISFFVGLIVYIATLPFFPPWLAQHFSAGKDSIMLGLRALMPGSR